MSQPPITNPQQASASEHQAQRTGPFIFTGHDVHFRSDRVQPPSNLYIFQDDHLRCEAAFDGLAGDSTTFVLAVRVLLPSGKIVPIIQPLEGVGPGYLAEADVNLPEGFLLSAALYNPEPGNRQCAFGCIYLARPYGLSQHVYGLLSADSISSWSCPQWPGGRTITPLDGAGFFAQYNQNAGIGTAVGQINLPVFIVLRPDSVVGTIATSSVAGNRNLKLTLQGGFYEYTWPSTIPASTTIQFRFGRALGIEQAAAVAGMVSVSLPDLTVDYTQPIQLAIESPQAGDSVTNMGVSGRTFTMPIGPISDSF